MEVLRVWLESLFLFLLVCWSSRLCFGFLRRVVRSSVQSWIVRGWLRFIFGVGTHDWIWCRSGWRSMFYKDGWRLILCKERTCRSCARGRVFFFWVGP